MVYYHLILVADGQEIDLKYDTFKRSISPEQMQVAIELVDHEVQNDDVTIDLYTSKSKGPHALNTQKASTMTGHRSTCHS